MFELNQAISNWRSALLQDQPVMDTDVEELEGHLREEVDRLILTGLDEEEAFMVAVHRMGDGRIIGQEFAKINPSLAWRRRAFWMLFGILAAMLVSGIASVCSQGSAALLVWLNVNAYGAGVTSVLVHIGVFVLLLCAVVLGLGLVTRKIRNRLTMSLTLVVCLISIFMLKVASFAINVLEVQVFGMETFGQLSVASHYSSFTWNILWPFVVVMLLFKFWSSRPQRLC